MKGCWYATALFLFPIAMKSKETENTQAITIADDYATKYTSDLPPLLQEVLDYTIANHSQHHMVSGHLQGQLLRMLSKLLRPFRVLEIGTFTGFSALCLAEGLQDEGKLYTLELREVDASTAQQFFMRSPNAVKIISLVGNAMDIIPTLQEKWDLVFIDADKTGYIGYFDLVLPFVREGGLIIADNVLFHGEVLKPEIKGKNAVAMAAYNHHVSECSEVESVMLTVRDGLLISRKKHA